MRNKLKHILVISLALCMMLAALPAAPAYGVSLQEQTWLKWLEPGFDDPVKNDSYPAQVIISAPRLDLTYSGKCLLKGEITDEEKISVLKEACGVIGEYKNPEDACEDQRLVDALTLKLSFKKADQDRIINNWIALFGLDKVKAILGDKLPEYGAGDAISIGTEVIGNLTELITTPHIDDLEVSFGSFSPVPLGMSDIMQGLIINGSVVTWDEFWKNQEQWKDRVTLLNTKARLRKYYDKVRLLMDDKERKNLKWSIDIDGQIIKSILYREVPEIYVPCICYFDAQLVKEGNGGNTLPDGTYTGSIKFRTALELSDFDANFHKYLAKAINDGKLKIQGPAAGQVKHVPYTAVSQSVQVTSENRYMLEGSDVSIRMNLPENSKKGRMESPVDLSMLEQKEYAQKMDMLSVVEQKSEAATNTLNWAQMEDSDAGVYYLNTFGTVVDISGKVQSYDNPENGSMPKPDMRQYIQMRIIVDVN